MENANLCVGGCRVQQLAEIISKILDPNITVVVTTAPAPRSALGECFGKANYNAQSKIVGFFKMLGVDYVFDTAFGADLTTISEAYEFIDRLDSRKNLPMFNSCCPAFVKFIENFHKELLPNLSTAKTPIAEIATFTKTIFAKSKGLNPHNIYIIALTPCIAKKMEIKGDFITEEQLSPFMPSKNAINNDKKVLTENSIALLQKLQQHEQQCELNCKKLTDCPQIDKKKVDNSKIQLTDSVITTSELSHLINLCELNLDDIEDAQCDEIGGESVKFGASGGVLECVVENAYFFLNNERPTSSLSTYTDLGNGIFEANIKLSTSHTINVARIIGLKGLEPFLKGDYTKYSFIEVMTCNGGCIGGTGQPPATPDKVKERRNILLDGNIKRYAFDNSIALNAFTENKSLFYDD